MRRFLVLLCALAVALAATIPAVPQQEAQEPASLINPVPSKDPWYNPPDGWEATKPGTPLSIRPNAYKVHTFNYTDVIQVMFRTTDSHGQPSYAVTTAFVPVSHARCLNGTNTTTTECSYGLISYQHPYDTACFDASPSWAMQNKDPWGEIGKGLERGWFVAVPDYEGRRAAFGANIVAGQTILDSMRALMQSMGKFGFRTADARLAIWGYSSGGTATAWALELAEKYAPDLKIHGGVIGGMSANQSESTPLLNRKDVAGLLIQGLIGLTSEYPELRTYLDSRLKPTGRYNKTEFYLASTMSGRDSMAYFVYQDVYQYFKGGIDDIYVPKMHEVMELEGSAGFKGTPRMPVFVHHGLEDEMAPYPAVDRVMDKWCKQGANIHYQRNIPGYHNRQLGYGQRYVLAFLEDIMTGSKKSNFPATGCKVETVFAHHDEDVPPY
jgi:hypothetical protein